MLKPKERTTIRNKIMAMAKSGKPFQRYDVMMAHFGNHQADSWDEVLASLVSEGALSVVKTLYEEDFEGKRRKVYQLKEESCQAK